MKDCVNNGSHASDFLPSLVITPEQRELSKLCTGTYLEKSRRQISQVNDVVKHRRRLGIKVILIGQLGKLGAAALLLCRSPR
jgi:hypothetical protein